MGVGRIPPEELPRLRRFQSQGLGRVFDPWAEQASGIERFHVEEALLEIAGGGIWQHKDRWIRDTLHENTFHVKAGRMTVTVLLYREWPDTVVLQRIGPFGA
jgi:hypothetical protein